MTARREGRPPAWASPPALDLDQLAVVGAGRDDAVAAGVFARDLHHRQHVAADLLVGIDHLRQAAALGQDQVVGQQHGKGLVAHHLAGAPDGMPQPQRPLLAGIDDLASTRDHLRQICQGSVASALAQGGVQLEALVEMVFQGRLAAARHHDQPLDPGFARLFHGILDQRLVDDRQHFLGHRLGGRQESGAEAGDRENGGADASGHGLLSG